jgi:formylglycine-generating enzyme
MKENQMKRRMKTAVFTILFVVLLLMSFTLSAVEGPRTALVIGNGNYRELGTLRNPPNDAADMAETLSQLGFSVELLIDADVIAMEDAVVRFGRQLQANRDAVGFFFYAGHGVQHQGDNYLIPSGASIGSEVFLRTRSISAQAVLDTMQAAGNALNVVVLDACRDNPFGWSRSGQRGLSQVSTQPPGSIIAYATGAGEVAGDGDGRNGVFTSELLKTLREPGLDVAEVFRRTGQAVRNATNGKQVPAVYSQFFDTAVLFPGEGYAVPSLPTPILTPAPLAAQSARTAELYLLSEPLGVEISINGEPAGRTPLFLDKIEVGALLVLEARKEGMSARREYQVQDTGLQEVLLELKRETGNLLILTTEQQAELYLNGESRGAVGTGLLRDMPTGEYLVELKVPGRKAEHRVTIKNGETVRVSPVFFGQTYRLDFDAEGGSLSGPDWKEVTYERPYGTLPEPAKTGYRFAGWWTGRSGSGREIVGTTLVAVTDNLTLYAKWGANTYTVSFDRQGGSGGSSGVTAVYGAVLPGATAPERRGYIFGGYYDQRNGAGRQYYSKSMENVGNWDKAAAATLYAKWEELRFRIPMTYVEGGSFQMGSTSGASDEKPVHRVRVDSFYIGTYEVTQDIYQSVMGSNPSNWKGDRLPVERVTWYEAVAFCNALSRLEGRQEAYTISGTNVSVNWESNGYRLPTEAEWEYAARGGAESQGYTYAGSNTVGDAAWYWDNSGDRTHPVGEKRPNELGLYDMSGNVWEWCWDWYGSSYYGSSPTANPTGPSSGSIRVLRGGSWNDSAQYVRTAFRGGNTPSYRINSIGFRVLAPAE